MPAKVCVLVSTYNGERFIREQIDSILNQSYPKIEIFIRDDGSSDSTPLILNEYKINNPKINIDLGSNIGAVASFFSLLQMADMTADFFSFCDQDDIWLPHKISRAVAVLTQAHNPSTCVYFSNLLLVNETLEPLGETEPPKLTKFSNALVENVITGATAVFGADIRERFLQAQPSHMIWHDWWLYLLASTLGQLQFDAQPLLQSRRHGQNQTTMRDTSKETIRNKVGVLKRVLKRKRGVDIFAQAYYFQQVYANQLSAENRILLGQMVQLHEDFSFWNRLIFVFNHRLRMGRATDNLGLKLLTLVGHKV